MTDQSDACDLSLVLACYNEAEHFVESVHQIFDVLDDSVYRYEIIFVDDRSQDGTPDLIRQVCDANPHRPLRAIFHEVNTGRGGAVSDGMKVARGKVVGFIDVDLEVQAHYVPSCVRAILRGEADVVIGHRYYALTPWLLYRHVLSRGYHYLVQRFLDLKLGDSESGYKFFAREALHTILPYTQDTHWFWDTEIVAYALLGGYRVQEIPVLFFRKSNKTSTVRPIHDSVYYVRHLVAFKRRLRTERDKIAALRLTRQEQFERVSSG